MSNGDPMKPRVGIVAVAVVALLLVANGCGGDDSASSTTRSNALTAPAGPKPARHCTEAQPYRYRVRNAEAAALVHTCRSRHWTSLSIENDSALVLDVWARGADAPLLSVNAPQADSFSDAAVARVVNGGWSSRRGSYVLTPGAKAVGTSYAPFVIEYKVNREAAGGAVLAKAAGSLIDAKLSAPGSRLTKQLAGCANGIESALEGSPYWEDTISDALGVRQCKSLFQTFAKSADEPPPSLFRNVLRKVRGATAQFDIDLLQWIVGRVRYR